MSMRLAVATVILVYRMRYLIKVKEVQLQGQGDPLVLHELTATLHLFSAHRSTLPPPPPRHKQGERFPIDVILISF